MQARARAGMVRARTDSFRSLRAFLCFVWPQLEPWVAAGGARLDAKQVAAVVQHFKLRCMTVAEIRQHAGDCAASAASGSADCSLSPAARQSNGDAGPACKALPARKSTQGAARRSKQASEAAGCPKQKLLRFVHVSDHELRSPLLSPILRLPARCAALAPLWRRLGRLLLRDTLGGTSRRAPAGRCAQRMCLGVLAATSCHSRSLTSMVRQTGQGRPRQFSRPSPSPALPLRRSGRRGQQLVSQRFYVNLRNRLLSAWWADPTQAVPVRLEDAAPLLTVRGAARCVYAAMLPRVHAFLTRHGHINFGLPRRAPHRAPQPQVTVPGHRHTLHAAGRNGTRAQPAPRFSRTARGKNDVSYI